MEWQAWTALATVAAAMTVLACTRIGPDLVLMAALTGLLTLGIVTPREALAGFANESLLAIAALLVVAAGLRDTGAVALVSRRLLGRPRTVQGALARLIFPAAFVSAFMSNTAETAILLPGVDDWSRKIGVPASKIMMPLSYSIILGGLCTLFGTSANMMASALLVSQAGLPGLGLFDITWVGLPCAAAGLTYLLVAGPRLLPDRSPAIDLHGDPREYTAEMRVGASSALAGQTIEQAGLRGLPDCYLVEIDRRGTVLPAVGPQELLEAGDHLVFAGVLESVVDLQKLRGLEPGTDEVFQLDSPRSHRCLVEAVVSDSCPLIGRTIREGRFRTQYNAAVIAVARHGERLRGKLGDVALRPGDTLLLECHPMFAEQQRNSRDFLLLNRVENSTPPRHDRAWAALAILVGAVAAATAGGLALVSAALLGAVLMLLTRCCSGPSARRSIDLKLLLVLAASFGLGRALTSSGAAAAVASVLIRFAGTNPWIALIALYAATVLFTEVISHTATVLLVFPIALATAHDLHVSVVPFVMAMTIAASCGFAVPVAYAPNLMVYGPGNYRFGDYLRFGGLLDLVVGVVAVTVAPLVWPF